MFLFRSATEEGGNRGRINGVLLLKDRILGSLLEVSRPLSVARLFEQFYSFIESKTGIGLTSRCFCYEPLDVVKGKNRTARRPLPRSTSLFNTNWVFMT